MDAVVAALREGRPVLLPTDTVYGLAAIASSGSAVAAMYALKGRDVRRPTALLAHTVDALLAALPELDAAIVRALLPGPYTLVLRNPARRFPWLNGDRPDAVGVRVPDLPEVAYAVLAQSGTVAATSANEPGAPPAATLDAVPPRIRAACPAVDAGRLPGTASTVLDCTGPEPVVLREGLAPAAEAIARLRAART